MGVDAPAAALRRRALVPGAGLVGVVAGSVLLGTAAATAPIVAVVVALGALGASTLARRPLAATGLLVGSFFFDELLSSGGLVTPGKLIGVMAASAWLVDTIRNRRPVVSVPHLWPLAVLCVWLVPSLAGAEDSTAGIVIASRYVMFAALFFLVVQATDLLPELRLPNRRDLVDHQAADSAQASIAACTSAFGRAVMA